MSDFKSKYSELLREQEILNQKLKEAKKDAIRHVQKIINEFGIRQSELTFAESGVKAKRKRAASPPMYRTPTGIEWSGKGLIKKELKAYLIENNLSLDDVRIK